VHIQWQINIVDFEVRLPSEVNKKQTQSEWREKCKVTLTHARRSQQSYFLITSSVETSFGTQFGVKQGEWGIRWEKSDYFVAQSWNWAEQKGGIRTNQINVAQS
jgi:hypothetical protein